MGKRVKAGLATAVLTAATLTACGGDGGERAGSDVVKLGAWTSESGPNAAAGVPQMTGTKVYFQMANDGDGCGGRQVDWITRDIAYDPQQTLQAARELVQREKVVAIVSPYGTITSEAAFPFVLKQSRTPIFGVAGGSLAWYEPPQDLLFGVEAVLQDQNAAMAQWAIEDGAKSFLVVHSDPASSTANAATVTALVRKLDASVRTDTLAVKYGTTDYSPVLRKVAAINPDSVLLNLPPEEAGIYLKQAQLSGVRAQTYAFGPASSPAVIELAGDAAERLRGVSLVRLPDQDTDELKEYRQAMAKYAPDAAVSSITLSGFGRAKAFCEVLGTIKGEVTRESVATALSEASEVETGIYPPLDFRNGQRLGTRMIQRVTVDGGKFVAVGDFVEPPSAN